MAKIALLPESRRLDLEGRKNRPKIDRNKKDAAKELQRQIEALPFVGTAEDKMRDWWAVPKRGGYVGGCMTGKAAAMAYLCFLRENADCVGSGMLQHCALDMLGKPRSLSLRGQAVGFFEYLGNILRQFAPLLDIEQDDQIRAKFRRGLNMNGPRTAAYIKELCAMQTIEDPTAKKDEARAQAEAA